MFQMGLASDMLDFKNTTAIIDPGTNELILVKTDEQGNPTNEIVNVSQLGYLSSQEELSYNYKDQIDKAIKRRGAKKTRDKDGKETVTILGAVLDTKEANTTIDALADSLLGDEAQVLSILYQNGYEFTQDESMKGKDKTIYFDINTNEYDYDRNDAKNILIEDIKTAIPQTILEAPTEDPLDKRLKLAQVQRAEGLAEIVKDEVKDLKLDKDSEDDAVSDITNFVKNEFPIPETFVKNQTNVEDLLTSGLRNLGYTYGKFNRNFITVNVPGGETFEVNIAGIDDAEGIVNKVVEAVFINKPITDIAKLAKVRGVLNPQKEAEETTKQNNGKRPLPQ